MDYTSKLPILQYIMENIQEDGTLDEDFSIRRWADSEERFADGFFEGMLLTSDAAGIADMPGELCRALQAASDNQFDEAEENIHLFFMEQDALPIEYIDTMQNWILANEETLDYQYLIKFAIYTANSSQSIPAVKIALSIMELFELGHIPPIRDMIQSLALCNEFTIYCIFAIHMWPDRNDVVYKMAQKVNGWGRVFAVNHVQAERDEIKSWLLTQSYNNCIFGGYSAAHIAKQVDMLSLLQNPELPWSTYYHTRNIMMLLLNDDGDAEISSIENKEELVKAFLLQTKRQSYPTGAVYSEEDVENNRIGSVGQLTINDFENVYRILRYVHRLDETPMQYRLKQLCGDILVTYACRDTIIEALKEGEGFNLARAMDIDCSGEAARLISEDPLGNIELLEFALGDDTAQNEQVIRIYENALPLDEIAMNSDKVLTMDEMFDDRYIELSEVVQELSLYPGLGERLLLCALASPSRQNRNTALDVIEQWKDQGATISEVLQRAADVAQETIE